MSAILDVRRYRLRALLAFLLISGFLAFVLVRNEEARSSGAEIVLETRPIDPRDTFFGHYAILNYNISPVRDAYDLMTPALRKAALDQWRAYQAAPRESRTIPENSAYAVLKEVGPYHAIEAIVSDIDKARSHDSPFLSASWRVYSDYNCIEKQAPEDGSKERCWRPHVSVILPERYYADPETAKSLEARMREVRQFQRQLGIFENCEKLRSEASEGDPAPKECDGVMAPPDAPPEFGIILSVSDIGEAVIKGVFFDGRKIYDSLRGPRITGGDLGEATER